MCDRPPKVASREYIKCCPTMVVISQGRRHVDHVHSFSAHHQIIFPRAKASLYLKPNRGRHHTFCYRCTGVACLVQPLTRIHQRETGHINDFVCNSVLLSNKIRALLNLKLLPINIFYGFWEMPSRDRTGREIPEIYRTLVTERWRRQFWSRPALN